jgi:hypothetical protein
MTYGGRLKANKSIQVRQIRTIEIDMEEDENRNDERECGDCSGYLEKTASLAGGARGL